MAVLFATLGIAVGTPLALLSLAYLAAASAYRQQALQDEEAARLWNRAPARPRTLAALAVPPAPRSRPPALAACLTFPKAVAKPRPSRHVKRSAAR